MATLKLGMYGLLKSQVSGGIIVNVLFVCGAAMLAGGLIHKTQTYNTMSARSYTSLMFLASVALLLLPSTSNARSSPIDLADRFLD